jgi:ABC-type multidrug transport system ATPase subunit
MDTKKEFDTINDINSFIYFFKKNVNFINNGIEKCLFDIFLTDDLNNNDKEMVKIFIHIMKKSDFKEIKLLFIILFIKKIKGLFDYTESNVSRNNFYNIAIKKIIMLIINTIAEKYVVDYFKEKEGDTIETLLTLFTEKFNSKMIYYILKKVEKIEDNDDSIKYTYQKSYKSILYAYSKFMIIIFHYIKIILLYINLYLISAVNNKISLEIILKTTAINIYYIIIFNTIYKKCKVNIKNENVNNNVENNIDTFFNNLPIIIEKNTLREEIDYTGKMVFENITNGGIDEKYRLKKLSNNLLTKSRIFSLYETIISIIIDNSSLLHESDSFRGYFENFATQSMDFQISLKSTNSFIEILNVKPYKVSKTIQWNMNDNYKYLFVLENIKLQYKYDNDKGDTIINKIVENVNINFEYGVSHILIGNSGSGKSSILNAMMKKMKITDGVIKFLGIHDEYTYYSIRKYLTHMNSESALFSKDIYFNIIYGLSEKIIKKNKEKIINTIIQYMKLFKLEDCIENIKTKNATELSKGQTQKVAIIRLFINIIFNDIRILFLDEITSNIDNNVEKTIYAELRNIQKIYRFTMVFVSHNIANIIYSDYNYRIDVEKLTINKNKTHDI